MSIERVERALAAATPVEGVFRVESYKDEGDEGGWAVHDQTWAPVAFLGKEPDARLIAAAHNLLPRFIDVVRAAETRERAEEALADWDEAHGYIVNSERDALAGDRADAIHALRNALAALDTAIQEELPKEESHDQ